jgi:hypothetical protein
MYLLQALQRASLQIFCDGVQYIQQERTLKAKHTDRNQSAESA